MRPVSSSTHHRGLHRRGILRARRHIDGERLALRRAGDASALSSRTCQRDVRARLRGPVVEIECERLHAGGARCCIVLRSRAAGLTARRAEQVRKGPGLVQPLAGDRARLEAGFDLSAAEAAIADLVAGGVGRQLHGTRSGSPPRVRRNAPRGQRKRGAARRSSAYAVNCHIAHDACRGCIGDSRRRPSSQAAPSSMPQPAGREPADALRDR